MVKRISKVVGGPEGCTHLLELTVSAIRVAATIILWKGHEVTTREDFESLSEEEKIQKTMSFMKDTCLPYKSSNV